MLAGFMLLLGIVLVGLFLVSLHAEHGPGAYESHD
jgi:hypothetical protein